MNIGNFSTAAITHNRASRLRPAHSPVGSKRAPCPVCNRGPRDKALVITTDERGTVQYCHRCGFTTAENFERIANIMPPKAETSLAWSDKAARIWRMTQPLGAIAESYLTRRGCVIPPADGDLRYLPPTDRHRPTLCARITDVVTAEPLSLHFTELRSDGSGRGERRLLAGHRKRGGVIRLWPDEAVTHGLAIAEGVETALAAAHLFRPIWAAVDAGNLEHFPVLAGVEALTIFADHDPAGLQAATACGKRWRDAGREVRILRARTPGHDVADIAGRLGSAA